ncbi:MAG TPA: OmpH family outer membrane protein [Stellaceae bacterium]|jgi:Skp family chaperone for outer membrane proteins|nr:OmpH family outer membrane protein [Stellaceae bacterium]
MAGLCAMLLAAPALAAPASGTDKGALVPAILIVDLPQVLHDSKAGKGVQATLSQESQAYSKEVAHQEDDLQRMRADLQRQQTALSQSAFDVKAKAFQLHYQELDRSVQAKRQALQKAYNDAMLKVEKAALDIIAGLAKERGANLVLAKQATILQPTTSDITTEVVARLDKTLASVDVSVPKTGTATTARRRERHKE